MYRWRSLSPSNVSSYHRKLFPALLGTGSLTISAVSSSTVGSNVKLRWSRSHVCVAIIKYSLFCRFEPRNALELSSDNRVPCCQPADSCFSNRSEEISRHSSFDLLLFLLALKKPKKEKILEIIRTSCKLYSHDQWV